jgi:heterodisulfide reductase subunit C
MMEIENNYQALVTALKLAVTAPTDEQAQECIEMAKSFAASLSPDKIERAKKEAS